MSKAATPAASGTELLVATFELERETKGAIRYRELGEDGKPHTDIRKAMIGSIYIRKDALSGNAPERIVAALAVA